MRKLAPEAFDSNGQVLNLIEGEWKEPGHPNRSNLAPRDIFSGICWLAS